MNLQWSGQERIPVAKEKVWAFVTDPASVAQCMPELVEYHVQDARNLDATVGVALGPVKGKFKFKIALDPQTDGEHVNMKISGGGLGSVVDLNAASTMTSSAPEETLLDWTASATMRGPVSTIGGRVIDAQAHRVISETFANVKTKLSGVKA